MSYSTCVLLPSWGKFERNQFVFGNDGDVFMLVDLEKLFVLASLLAAITITYDVKYGIFLFYLFKILTLVSRAQRSFL
jgi:hypothetical protein